MLEVSEYQEWKRTLLLIFGGFMKRCEGSLGHLNQRWLNSWVTINLVTHVAWIISIIPREGIGDIPSVKSPTYGSLAAYAKVLGEKKCLSNLLATLKEEKNCDKLLSTIADTALNSKAK